MATLNHDPIEPIPGFEDLFMVHGEHRFAPGFYISRNMTIVRNKSNGDLTLISPMKLSEDGLNALKELGNVKYLLRLGHFHGADDMWYKEKFADNGVEIWAVGKSESYPEDKVPVDKYIGEEDVEDFKKVFPLGNSEEETKLILFKNTKETAAEGAILVKKSLNTTSEKKGLLLTVDALQYFGNYTYFNCMGRFLSPKVGFKDMCIGPPWPPASTAEGKSCRSDFELICEEDFDMLFSAHGTLCESGAKEGVKKAIVITYGEK